MVLFDFAHCVCLDLIWSWKDKNFRRAGQAYGSMSPLPSTRSQPTSAYVPHYSYTDTGKFPWNHILCERTALSKLKGFGAKSDLQIFGEVGLLPSAQLCKIFSFKAKPLKNESFCKFELLLRMQHSSSEKSFEACA